MVRDSIAELVNGMKNACRAGKPSLLVRNTKLVKSVVACLEKEGLVLGVKSKGKDLRTFLDIELNPLKPVEGASRVSHLSKRVYRGAHDLVVNSRIKAIYILTTPKGVMSHREARKQNVGGEVMFKIW